MRKPHVLVLSPHAGIAEGLVRLLSLEGRYDVRRVSSPAQLGGIASEWRADVVLVDGAVIRNGEAVLPLPAPALVLSGTAEDANLLLPRVPTAKGWLRKDPTYPELERALAQAGATSSAPAPRRMSPLVIASFAVAVAGAALACVWLLLN